jgi:uncharacterized protein (DUF849 family)
MDRCRLAPHGRRLAARLERLDLAQAGADHHVGAAQMLSFLLILPPLSFQLDHGTHDGTLDLLERFLPTLGSHLPNQCLAIVLAGHRAQGTRRCYR